MDINNVPLSIFSDDENEIANNIARKVKPKDEMNKNNRTKNDTRF